MASLSGLVVTNLFRSGDLLGRLMPLDSDQVIGEVLQLTALESDPGEVLKTCQQRARSRRLFGPSLSVACTSFCPS